MIINLVCAAAVAAETAVTASPTFFEKVADIFNKIWMWTPALMTAAGTTIALAGLSIICGLVIAIFLALGKMAKTKIVSAPCSAYIFFFRGTPLMMQLFFIYFTLPQIVPALNITDKFTAAFIAFTLNVAAYLAEIIRAALQSIDKGQFEASKALGLSYSQAMRLVIIPQATRRMLPPVGNEFIMLLKDTSLVSMIGLTDLTFQTKIIASNKASALVYIPAMIIYLVITAIFTYVFNKAEKKLAVYE